jgi:hypothetical protein
MSHLKRAALAVATAFLFAVPSSALAATPVATTPTPQFQRVTIGATTGVVYLTRAETRQVGQGGAWVVAGAVGLALAPSTAGVGTIAAIAVGVALGAVGSKLIDAQLVKSQCLKVSTPWLSLGTTAKIGWYPCIV